TSHLFPYTTLFRSDSRRGLHAKGGIHKPERRSRSPPARLCDSTQQGRQRCSQSTDAEKGSPEEDFSTKEIRAAEVNFLSMPFGVYSSGIPPFRTPWDRKVGAFRLQTVDRVRCQTITGKACSTGS